MALLKRLFGQGRKTQPISQAQPKSEVQPTNRADWVEQALAVVNANPPSNKITVNLIAIEPPPHIQKFRQEVAEEYVRELEQQGKKFEQVNIRVVASWSDKHTNQYLIRHADIKGGQITGFFWPPHDNWDSSPIIGDGSEVRHPANFP